ncbi:Glutaryl-CoA dehydrogenase (plasmid) [Variovorax sp. SRS16]|uniref:acyl-CoA dehydrogenase family protein n=1 Tax=Variovorax sp. SRS16 TaxID=282217 RepID=UPI001317171E|nr:acyl-CoA dehydrogenase family protein [Variovorax sp. SRS16]VTU45746.1 Glutaryl-CoA dehydrogenase [Variovorax sp. SRS16]
MNDMSQDNDNDNDTAQFADMAERLFGDIATPARIESAEDGTFARAIWTAVEEVGIGLALVPEGAGGIGAGLADAAAILQAAGRHALPVPVLELIMGNALLALVGREPAAGPLCLLFADGEALPTRMRGAAWAAASTQVLVVARAGTGAGARLAVLPTSDLRLQDSIADAAAEPASDFTLPPAIDWLPIDGMDFDALLRRAALLRGAQMIGAMRWCLERTTAYALERRQFGREIGKFQVVQQMIAELASAVVAAHAMLDAAIAAPDDRVTVAAARSRLGDAADTVFALSHQVHGAIGFSYEYALHFRTRRLMAWRDQFGSVPYWRRQLAAAFAGCQADEVWPLLAGT